MSNLSHEFLVENEFLKWDDVKQKLNENILKEWFIWSKSDNFEYIFLTLLSVQYTSQEIMIQVLRV